MVVPGALNLTLRDIAVGVILLKAGIITITCADPNNRLAHVIALLAIALGLGLILGGIRDKNEDV